MTKTRKHHECRLLWRSTVMPFFELAEVQNVKLYLDATKKK